MTDTIEAEMKVSPFRRWFSSGLVALTAALLLNMAMTTPPASVLGQGLVWGMATLLLIAALKLWRACGVRVLPGAYLGRDGPKGNPGAPYIRVALVAGPDDIERGLTAIRDILATELNSEEAN